MTWETDAANRYGAVLVGLLVGTGARYGLALNEGRSITVRGVCGDILLLGLIGLMATLVSNHLELGPEWRAFVAAIAAVCSDRLIRLVQKRFLETADTQLSTLANSKLIRLSPGHGEPTHVEIEDVSGDPQMVALRKAYPAMFESPESIEELIRKLKEIE